MAEPAAPPPEEPPVAPRHALARWLALSGARRAVLRRRFLRALRKYALGLPLALLLVVLALPLLADSPLGHRLIADLIAEMDLGRGLSAGVGRIDGSLFGHLRLSEVVLRDDRGVFLRAPQLEVDWRPLALLEHRVELRNVALRRASLLRVPHLQPGSNQPTDLGDWAVQVNRLAVERLTVARAVAGSERRVDLRGELEWRQARRFVSLNGRLGGGDRLAALFEDDRAANRFGLDVDYVAPRGGLLAALSGARADRRLRIAGQGNWQDWHGGLVLDSAGARAAALLLTHRGAHVGLAGLLGADPLVPPALRQALGGPLAITAEGDLAGKGVAGRALLASPHLLASAAGQVDSGGGLGDVTLDLASRGDMPLDDSASLSGARLHALVNRNGDGMRVDWRFTAARLSAAGKGAQPLTAEGLSASGQASQSAAGWRLPVDLAVARLGTGNGALDPQLARGRAHATFTFAKGQLAAPDLALSWPALRLALALKAEPARGAWALAGRASSSGWPVAGVGRISGQAGLALTSARGQGWRLGVDLKGAAAGLKDGSLAALVGDSARLSARLAADSAGRMDLSQAALTGPRLSLALSGQRRADGGFAFAGHGQQVTYGAFSATGSWGRDGPHGEVRLADPLPVLGVKQVVVGITPAPAGAALAITGQSMLGPMDGTLALALPKDGPARLDVRRLAFSGTVAAGSLRLAGGGVDGALSLSGGGVNGSVELARRDGGQAVDLSLRLTNAHFGGDQPLTIGLAHLEANGLIRRDHTTIAVAGLAQGVGKGRLFIGRLAANAKLEDGSGTINVALGGRRGSRFDLEAQARVAPEKMDLLARGSFGNQPISMPQRARLAAERRPDGGFAGWRLAPAEVDYGGGRVMAEGFLGNGSMDLKLGVVDMPLSLGDVVFADMGLSGRATGLFNWTQQREQMPEANAELMIKGLSRAGLTTTSRPVDVALVGRLEKTALQLRARAAQGGQQNGRLQARVDNLPEQGTLAERLAAGRLFAQLRYGGPADALWRLMALNDLDLSGPVDLAADITGSLRDPLIRGSLAGDDLRLQGPQMGMDITHMATRASFDGSRLVFARLAGKTAGNGEVSGSGMVDFTALGHKGPAIDLRLAAKKAQLVGRADMSLAVTGPLRIVSDGESGTIAGRVVIDMARWRLGQAADVAEIPVIATQESNRRADIAPASAREVAWSFLVDGAGGNVRLQGLGLDSIWRAAIRLRGPLDDPSLQGHADLLSGSYEFAGKRFDLTRGLITMDGTTPTDPRLDIAATASVSDINATVTVRGSALRPEITFSSVPPMPEEELLSRLLFGTSVTSISAPEAVQLGTAVASLHGGGGLDPINRLRGAIGVDRLRIISADPAQDRQTGLAVGKYLGRRVYAEVVSDGRGYSATNLEFRLTSWLALLGTVSTIGRQSVNAKITHDY